ncbi:MAG: UDP-GlcNAc--UDP-phosphate GlcNAc-1-phosphate transferase [Flavobacteriaceae bacterium]
MDLLIIPLLVLAAWIYMKLAIKYNIVDRPNERSSHTKNTIRGGGIIFFLSIVFFFVFYEFQYPYFVLGLTLVAGISFLDDIYTLGSAIRIFFQILAIGLSAYQIGLLGISPLWLICAFVLSVGLLNIYNFMDGINGITGLYSISILLALLYVNHFTIHFINQHLLLLSLASVLIFGYYNFRKRARFFAVDIGSISIGLILIFCVGKLIFVSYNLWYLLFFLIYFIDGGSTILERVLRRENIFKPHRRHLYQLIVDQKKTGHISISLGYFFMQLLINSVVILSIGSENYLPITLATIAVFVGYLFWKIKILKNG